MSLSLSTNVWSRRGSLLEKQRQCCSAVAATRKFSFSEVANLSVAIRAAPARCFSQTSRLGQCVPNLHWGNGAFTATPGGFVVNGGHIRYHSCSISSRI